MSSATALSGPKLQFFVRIFSDHTRVFHADPQDTVGSIHEKIQSTTGIPSTEQRLIYRRKQLQWEHTLSECGLENDASLQLVGRTQSSGNLQAWQLVNDLVSLTLCMCKANPTSSGSSTGRTNSVQLLLDKFIGMTPREPEKASSHLQIFSASTATVALVMLYMSPNKDIGFNAITSFTCTAFDDKPFPLIAPMLFEFCFQLRKVVGVEDPLYRLVRNSVVNGVRRIEISNNSSFSVPHLFPFVSELADKLSDDLLKTLTLLTLPSYEDVDNFSALISYITNWILGDKRFCCPIRVEEQCSHFRDEVIILHHVFYDLLSRLEKCLDLIEFHLTEGRKIFERREVFEKDQLFSLLRGVNSISKIFLGLEELFWNAIKERKYAFSYIIITGVRTDHRNSDDYIWVAEGKKATNSEARRHLAMMFLPVNANFDNLHEMVTIDRNRLFVDSFEYIRYANSETLRAGFPVMFKNEEAIGSGVLREWVFLVCQEIFREKWYIFVPCPDDGRRFFPLPDSGEVLPLMVEFYNFAGKLFALALMHKVQVGIMFDRLFFVQLGGYTVTLDDIRDADPTLYNSSKQILEMDPKDVDRDVLGLTFSHQIKELEVDPDSLRLVDLCPDGKNVIVNSQNRGQYVDLLVQHCFVERTARQVDHFARGFAEILGSRRLQMAFFQFLNLEDLDMMLYGSEDEIDVDDWKAHTDYNGFEETDAQISWFWEIVGNIGNEQRKVLLFFWTSIKSLPIKGFCGLASRLCIHRNSEDKYHLPSAQTCFYQLFLPVYPDKGVLKDRLSIITEEFVRGGFGIH